MSEIETLVAELINRATRIGEGAALTGRAYESDVTLAAAARAAILREFDAQAKRIRELEAAQRWIPVSERLPENGVEVLVTIDVCGDGSGIVKKAKHEHGKWIVFGMGEWATQCVLAWRPLPEPYEATS